MFYMSWYYIKLFYKLCANNLANTKRELWMFYQKVRLFFSFQLFNMKLT